MASYEIVVYPEVDLYHNCYGSPMLQNYGIWGPFLIVAPLSTVHNWQQELNKFNPSLKVCWSKANLSIGISCI